MTFLHLDMVVVVMEVVTINKADQVVAEAETIMIITGIIYLNEFYPLNYLLITIYSGQKRSYSDYNSRSGGGKNIFSNLVCRFLTLQKLTPHTG